MASGAVDRDRLAEVLRAEDAIWVGAELSRRFGLARRPFTLTATDANRSALRLARRITGCPCSATAITARSTRRSPPPVPARPEPAMTNMGIVLPDPGYRAALRAYARDRHPAGDRRDAHVCGRAGWVYGRRALEP